ncbi:ABC transporter ATP-binding protein [Paenibacillus sp. MBLB4367]|uniref:ABC transporter ATP-binding protein n=1 Tax=Paenibacillus sp. MBLB4367 TaxID=3384767 RepID=UPI0039081E8C
MENNEPLLRIRDVERTFGAGTTAVRVLKGISADIHARQLIVLKGRSGSGKTTLLNLLGGLDAPSDGQIWFGGSPLHAWNDEQRTRLRRQRIGFIFQAYALLPLLSAYENVELSLRLAGTPKAEWKKRIADAFELVGLAKRMHHRPFELSGGEQQRVAIAKAIVHRPTLLLADEPTAELDSRTSAQVMSVFRHMLDTEPITICMTTHDPTTMEAADHVYEMVDGTFRANPE